ncbi:MAG: exonuclease domain-containing protein [Helicobacter sp.]|nr:exonuclease domain-containing protein [Helicobacter sp.]
MLCSNSERILKSNNIPLPQHLDDIFALKKAGLWLSQNKNKNKSENESEIGFYLDVEKNLDEVTFCFVDIESTDSKPANGKLLEIGAIKYKLGSGELGKFHTLIHNEAIPKVISDLTGIKPDMLVGAPSEREGLLAFREFLGDSVFVAHNVNFDYGFLSSKLRSYDFMPLLNPRLCTQICSRAQILSKKHSLGFLNVFLGLNFTNLHRAHMDAKCALRVFEIAAIPVMLQDVATFKEFATKIQKKDYYGY